LAVKQKTEYKGSKRKRIKEQRKEAIKQHQKKQEKRLLQQDLYTQGEVQATARALEDGEGDKLPIADAKYPSPRVDTNGNQLDDDIAISLDPVNTVNEELPLNEDNFSKIFSSMRLNAERVKPESGPGITFGMNNPKEELRGQRRMHLINPSVEYIDETEQNEDYIDAEVKPEMVFADRMGELEILEWVSIYKSTSTGRLPRIMQGPGYSRANKILNSKPRVRSRTKKYEPLPVVFEATRMTEAEATAIMNMNLIDQYQIEDEQKEHGGRPESVPPDDIDLNRSISVGLMSSLHEGSSSILDT